MRAIVLLIFLLPAAAPAASLHKCVGADGVASYQSLPCAPGHRTVWTREAGPFAEPAPLPAPLSQAAAPARPRLPPRTQRVAREAPDPSASRCAAARRAADLRRDRLWNRLSFRQRSDLDAKVAQACANR